MFVLVKLVGLTASINDSHPMCFHMAVEQNAFVFLPFLLLLLFIECGTSDQLQ